MIRQHFIVCTCALLLAGCATTDGTRSSANAYDNGHYVAAHDGLGHYYYDQPQVVTSYDPWYPGFGWYGYGFGWYGPGFGPWGFRGWGSWYGPPPWYWHHHHHHDWYVAGATQAGPGFRPAPSHPQEALQARHFGQPSGNPRGPAIRAPRHGSQHQRP